MLSSFFEAANGSTIAKVWVVFHRKLDLKTRLHFYAAFFMTAGKD
jgi:hypothetical protein